MSAGRLEKAQAERRQIIADIDAQIKTHPELVTPADEVQLDRLGKLLDIEECKTHPDAPHGFLRNASHNEGRYVCECELWEDVEQAQLDRKEQTEKDSKFHGENALGRTEN
jgi:hypothetical protein